jgi:hypothetical protein
MFLYGNQYFHGGRSRWTRRRVSGYIHERLSVFVFKMDFEILLILIMFSVRFENSNVFSEVKRLLNDHCFYGPNTFLVISLHHHYTINLLKQ